MDSIDNLTVHEYLENLAAPSFPGPTSGSAAATAAAMAAALLEMSFAVTIKKDESKSYLQESLKTTNAIRNRCLVLATEDIKAYAEVVGAAKFKGEFPQKYEAAMKKATETMTAIVENCYLVLTQIEEVFNISYLKVLGDLAGAACLAEAAAEAAKLGTEINLRLLDDEQYTKNVLNLVRESYRNCSEVKQRIITAMDEKRN